jgi:hypothetical protein
VEVFGWTSEDSLLLRESGDQGFLEPDAALALMNLPTREIYEINCAGSPCGDGSVVPLNDWGIVAIGNTQGSLYVVNTLTGQSVLITHSMPTTPQYEWLKD